MGGVYVMAPHMIGVVELVCVSVAPMMDVVPLITLFEVFPWLVDEIRIFQRPAGLKFSLPTVLTE